MYYKGYFINVVMLDEAYGIPGSVHKNRDDSYTIFIDASLCREKQQEVFKHELGHIFGDDFNKNDVQQIEWDAHQYEFSDELCSLF